jgi:hypothetical protein
MCLNIFVSKLSQKIFPNPNACTQPLHTTFINGKAMEVAAIAVNIQRLLPIFSAHLCSMVVYLV